MTWTPSDALVEKVGRTLCWRAQVHHWIANNISLGADGGYESAVSIYEHRRAEYDDQARAALLACRDDMVAEAVRAEAEACAETCIQLWNDAPNTRPEYWQTHVAAGCIESAAAIRRRHT